MPKVAICAPTYKGAHRLDWLLQSIFRVGGMEEVDAKVVILDDGSPDGGEAVRYLGQKYGVDTIIHDRNKGIPAAWNSLTEHFKAPITILLNDDIIVTPGWLFSMVYFLNNNPRAGSASWPMYFSSEEDVKGLLVGEDVCPRDPITKKQQPEHRGIHRGVRPGRIMCPAGACFGFTYEKYLVSKSFHNSYGLTGGFPEEFLSFHEESSFGTALAQAGFITYGLTWPAVWHLWSATFKDSPELNASWRMQHSRKMYCDLWNVPTEFRSNPFSYTNPCYCPQIPPNRVKWVGMNYELQEEMEPDTRVEHE